MSDAMSDFSAPEPVSARLPMLRLDNLTKRYDTHVVFNNLSYTFTPGCVALCEEESTGKSTLLGIIAGILAPDSGDILIDNLSVVRSPAQALARLSWVPDNCLQAPMQTGRGMLQEVAARKNAVLDEAVMDLARRLDLEPHLDKRFEQMSTGMRRKVYLTAAALGDPAVIVADGPDGGLDGRARAVLGEQFNAWAKAGKVVVFSSFDTELLNACNARVFNIRDHAGH